MDGKLREILRWGIPEPGGAGRGRAEIFPRAFLATALLSTQAEVTAVLWTAACAATRATRGGSGLLAALQAVAQDLVLFAALLRQTQARRDEAYTDKGARKTARGTPFKVAAERLNEARDEKERLQRTVEDSEAVESRLRELDSKHGEYEEAVDAATHQREALERLAAQAAIRNAAAEEVERARQEVSRIKTIASEVNAAERRLADLAHAMEMAEEAARTVQARRTEADAAFESAQEAAAPPHQKPV